MTYPLASHPSRSRNDLAGILRCGGRSTLGYDTAWVFDHFLPIFSDPTGPCLDGWTALAGLAMASKNVRIGTMVTGNTYRHPAVCQDGDDGRYHQRRPADFGSARMVRAEHQQYGIPFHTLARVCAASTSAGSDQLCDGARQLHGKHSNARCELQPQAAPAASSSHPVGARREFALRIVAKHADMWNTWPPEIFATRSRGSTHIAATSAATPDDRKVGAGQHRE